MKKIFLILVLTLIQNSVFAGEEGCKSPLKLCPHERVVYNVNKNNGQLGEIVGLNPLNSLVSIRLMSDNTIVVTDTSNITVTKGCIDQNYCVDKVAAFKGVFMIFDMDYEKIYLGTIVGVNPFTRMVSIQVRDQIVTRSVTNVAVDGVCLSGFCAGDEVVTSGGNIGIIKGINKFNNKAAIQITEVTGANTLAKVDEVVEQGLSEITISKYCKEYDQNSKFRNLNN